MRGYEVAMTTGTDEHGVNVERAAKKAGNPRSEFVASMADAWRALWDELVITADEFVRTTDSTRPHRPVAVQARREMATSTKATTPASTASTTTPIVNDAKPGDPLPGLRTSHSKPSPKKLFLQALRFPEPLLDFYRKNPDFIQPESRKNEIVSFRRRRPERSQHHPHHHPLGHPRPGEEPHVFYVWFDALTAYLSAVGGPDYESAACGPPMSISSAKTSSGSTPSTGPRS